MVDYVTPGLMEDHSPRIAANNDRQEDDVGSFQIVCYRTDVATTLGLGAPQTWDDYIAFAKAAQGKDFGTGKPGYGSCIAKKRGGQFYWMITSIAGAFLQSKGTSQGAFFDLDGFKPLTNNDGFAAALECRWRPRRRYSPSWRRAFCRPARPCCRSM